jgi:hypothetical protein
MLPTRGGVQSRLGSHYYLLWTQYGHRRCALFTFPQAEHLFSAVTSFNAFPAICRCRLFECGVFFLGTARRIDSHIPDRRDGMLRFRAAGSKAGTAGRNRRTNCLATRLVVWVRVWCISGDWVRNNRKDERNGGCRKAIEADAIVTGPGPRVPRRFVEIDSVCPVVVGK